MFVTARQVVKAAGAIQNPTPQLHAQHLQHGVCHPQVIKRQLLELGDEEFLAETGTIVSQASYHQSVIRINTKLVYAQVSGGAGMLRGLRSDVSARR